MPNSKKRPDGYYTVGMQDLSFAVPDNYLIGCAATCADLTYPNPSPGPENVTPIANPDGSLPDPNVITPPSN